MNKNFEKIYETAKQKHGKNKIDYQNQLEKQKNLNEEKLKEEASKREKKSILVNPKTDSYSKELYFLINQYEFSIDSYEKFTEFDEHDYEPTLETYYCSKNDWQFKVHNYSDVDIKEGIFAATDLKHTITGEEVDFYCDLGCRNTSQNRLDEFLEFLSFNSLDSYIKDKYKKYLMLPELLRKQGFTVEEVDYSFQLNKPNGYLKLGKKLFVKVYHAWYDNLKVVVTNEKDWNINSSNDRWGKRAYYFDFKSEEDVEEFAKCIRLFEEHMNGHIGYFANDKFYGNEDIFRFFNSLRDKDNYYKECWNTYQIKVEHKKFWDGRGYNEEAKIINKYKGLEIYTQTELTFNDAAQWSKGEIKNTSNIIFEYDKQKSSQCRLLVENYIYEDSYEEYDAEGNLIPDETKMVGKVEEYGTFEEMFKLLQDYVYEMIKIHEIEL